MTRNSTLRTRRSRSRSRSTAGLAIGTLWIGEAQLSTFAVFGSVAFLLFADFPGAERARLGAYGVLTVVGAGLIVAGTLASQIGWLAVAAMAVVGFLVLFSGVLSAAAAARHPRRAAWPSCCR